MKKILISFILMLVSSITMAQGVPQLYEKYYHAVKEGEKEVAFKSLEECRSKVALGPFISTAYGILCAIGYGTEVDVDQAAVSFICTITFDSLRKKSIENDPEQSYTKNFGEIEGKQMDDLEIQMYSQHDKYMALNEPSDRLLKAFSARWLAFLSYNDYLDYKSENDTENMLYSIGKMEERASQADSLTNDAYSQYLLARIYMDGLLGFKNNEVARQYLDLSCKANCISALVYSAKLDLRKNKVTDAKKKLLKAVETPIVALRPITKDDFEWLSNPNINLFDVNESLEEAKRMLNELK